MMATTIINSIMVKPLGRILLMASFPPFVRDSQREPRAALPDTSLTAIITHPWSGRPILKAFAPPQELVSPLQKLRASGRKVV